MILNYILVNLAGLVLIGLTLWWFFGSKPVAMLAKSDKPITILVKEGVYQPSRIQIASGKSIKLRFIREDATPCAEAVVFPQLTISHSLPLHQPIEFTIPPQPKGELDFTCQMAMYRGKSVIV